MLARLFILSIATELLYGLLATLSLRPPSESPFAPFYHPLRFEETSWFLLIWAALFVLYALAIAVGSRRDGRGVIAFLFVTSAVFRATLLWNNGFAAGGPPIFLQGASPLGSLFASLPSQLPGREMVSASVSNGLLPCLFDLAALGVAIGLLRRASLPVGLALIHGWNPLLIKEVAGSGRVEIVALFFLLLSFRLAQRDRPNLAALAYGLALTGPLTLAATLPLLAKALRLRLALSLLVAAGAWGFLASGGPLELLVGWPPSTLVGGSVLPALAAVSRLFVTRNDLVPLGACAVLWLAVAFFGTVRLRADLANLPRQALLLIGFLAILSPEALPWTFLPMAALGAYSANRGWIVLTATAMCPYFALTDGAWSFWLGFVQYFPGYATLVFQWLGGRPEGVSRAR